MPVYDYLCAQCGPFTDMRPMAESDRSKECPTCGKKAPRALLTAPYLAAMPVERRLAHVTNERSATTPQTLSGSRQSHGAGCNCCSAKSLRSDKRARGAANGSAVKSFAARRPWMISH